MTQEPIVKIMFLTMLEIWLQYLMLVPMIFSGHLYMTHTFGWVDFGMRGLRGFGATEHLGDTRSGSRASPTMGVVFNQTWPSISIHRENGMMNIKIFAMVLYVLIKVANCKIKILHDDTLT